MRLAPDGAASPKRVIVQPQRHDPLVHLQPRQRMRQQRARDPRSAAPTTSAGTPSGSSASQLRGSASVALSSAPTSTAGHRQRRRVLAPAVVENDMCTSKKTMWILKLPAMLPRRRPGQRRIQAHRRQVVAARRDRHRPRDVGFEVERMELQQRVEARDGRTGRIPTTPMKTSRFAPNWIVFEVMRQVRRQPQLGDDARRHVDGDALQRRESRRRREPRVEAADRQQELALRSPRSRAAPSRRTACSRPASSRTASRRATARPGRDRARPAHPC